MLFRMFKERCEDKGDDQKVEMIRNTMKAKRREGKTKNDGCQ